MSFLDFATDDLPIATEEGYFVSAKHMRVAEIIRDYDPNLEIQFIPEGQRAADEPPYRVVFSGDGRSPAYTVCYAHDLDGPLLERIFKMDAEKQGNILDDIDAHNQAIKALADAKRREEWEEMKDLTSHIVKSPKSRYKHNGVVYE